jgi:hypothetical protein
MRRLSLHIAALALSSLALLTGCSTTADTAPVFTDIQPFSANRAGLDLPRGWSPWIITRAKAPTRYDLVVDRSTQRIVLHAVAERSATGLKQRLDIDPATRPIVQWEWRIVDLVPAADLTDRDADDSPARLLLFFDGDRTQLSARDKMLMETARLLTGQPIPFATLMYVWDNRQPVGTVIPSAVFGKLKMVVAGTGPDRLGQWKQFARNYVHDDERAFGHAPGKLVGIGVLTDTDNTASAIEAFYGDIRLRAAVP